jgi:septal ring factor EnvC (AmiA/AmiB activator)
MKCLRIAVQDERDRLRQKVKGAEESHEAAAKKVSDQEGRLRSLQEEAKKLSEAKRSLEKASQRMKQQIQSMEGDMEKEKAERAALEARVVVLQERSTQAEAEAEAAKKEAEDEVPPPPPQSLAGTMDPASLFSDCMNNYVCIHPRTLICGHLGMSDWEGPW